MKVSNILFLMTTLLFCETSVGFFGFKRTEKKVGGLDDDIPYIVMSNDIKMPLVGQGVGNLEKEKVESMVYQGIKNGHKVRLIDTSHKSGNEKLVSKGIVAGVKKFKETDSIDAPIQVHVVTKVWYTHLGYERTKLSVEESLLAFNEAIQDPNVDLRVHFLIHWPRCYQGVEWMDCEQEEEDLPEAVKKAGPPAYKNKDAWKESWKALEDMYDAYPEIAGIGVSNFKSSELMELMGMARIQPHLAQMNVWSLLNDPPLVNLCHVNHVNIQVFNVMNGVLGYIKAYPHAYHHLLMVTDQVQKKMGETPVSPSQLILKWLIHYGIAVIPRTSSFDRLKENSAMSLQAIPDFSIEQEETIAQIMEAALSGVDMEDDAHVKVTFHAENSDMALFFEPGPTDEDEIMIALIRKGQSFEETTHPGHHFRLYNATDPFIEFNHIVEGAYGEHYDVRVELDPNSSTREK